MTTKSESQAGQPAWDEKDSQRIRRLMARFIGGGYVAYFIIAAPAVQTQVGLVARWWTPVAILAVFVPGWLLLAASFSRFPRVTTVILPLACGGGYVVGVATWFLAWTGERTADNSGTWLVTFPGLAALALVVTPWPWISMLHLTGVTLAVQIANAAARAPRYGALTLADIGWAIAFSGVFVLAGIMAVRTGDQLDETKAQNILLSEQVHAQRGQELERNLYDRLVHDKVLGLMRNAELANIDPNVRAEARKLLQDWDGLAAERSSKRPIDTGRVIALVREAIQQIDPALDIDLSDKRRPSSPVVPLRVGHALADAAAEAVRNVRRHAGAEVRIDVSAQLSCEPLVVTVTDDGPGFDRASVGATAMGVSRSIVDRITDVGGQAHIDSVVGVGTTVELRWPR